LFFFRTPWARYNGHEDIDNRRMLKDNFDGKAHIEVVFDREEYPRNGVQDRAFIERLIAIYDQLRKINVLTNFIGTQLVNIV